MTYAFTFDASACTGCKACQVACKDKNQLPTGALWRRVFEVSGGDWAQAGNAWENSVFAYNLSLGCNHCVHPKCAGVCPTDAYIQRADGVVYIDESKCMGCGYCAWACPYSVPQYNPKLGHMTKCNFCMDELDQGKPPACVAACPMRVLDFSVISDQYPVSSDQWSVTSGEYQELWEKPASAHPFPLPAFSRTQPHLALKPHAAMGNGLEKTISNWEEVKPLRSKPVDELPLVAFTLLAQMSAGMAVAGSFFQTRLLNLLTIGLLLGLAGLISFLHLGTKKNAWRAVMHLQKSWLSREILLVGLFGASWLVSFLEYWLLNTENWSLMPVFLGIGLVYSMTQVYRFKAAPAWNTWRTQAAFFLSAGTLGLTGIAFGEGVASVAIPLLFLLLAEVWVMASAPNRLKKMADRLRLGLIATAVAAVLITPVIPSQAASGLILPIFLLVLTQEIIGRWLFYEMRQPAL